MNPTTRLYMRIAGLIHGNRLGAGNYSHLVHLANGDEVRYRVSWASGMSFQRQLGKYRGIFGTPPEWIYLLHPATARAVVQAAVEEGQCLPDKEPAEIESPGLGQPVTSDQFKSSETSRESSPWATGEEWRFSSIVELLPKLLGCTSFQRSLKRELLKADRDDLESWLTSIAESDDPIWSAADYQDEIENSVRESGREHLSASWESDGRFGPGGSGFFSVYEINGIYFTGSSDYPESGPHESAEAALWIEFSSAHVQFSSQKLRKKELIAWIEDNAAVDPDTNIAVADKAVERDPDGVLRFVTRT